MVSSLHSGGWSFCKHCLLNGVYKTPFIVFNHRPKRPTNGQSLTLCLHGLGRQKENGHSPDEWPGRGAGAGRETRRSVPAEHTVCFIQPNRCFLFSTALLSLSLLSLSPTRFIIGNEFCERFCYYGMRGKYYVSIAWPVKRQILSAR